MLPKMRTVLVTVAAAFMVASIGLGLLTSSRTVSVFSIGLRSAQGSPVARTLPEPPEWRQSAARAAERRAEELERLLDLVAAEPAVASQPAPDVADPATTGSIPQTREPPRTDDPPAAAPAELHPQ